jgi:hypothetical protein
LNRSPTVGTQFGATSLSGNACVFEADVADAPDVRDAAGAEEEEC